MHVQAMVNTISDLGNPFCDDSTEIFSLYSKDMADGDVLQTINKIKRAGQQQY